MGSDKDVDNLTKISAESRNTRERATSSIAPIIMLLTHPWHEVYLRPMIMYVVHIINLANVPTIHVNS